jgi:UDP-N-acetylglucosamine 2-epimerase (non-hydrolysing)
VVTGLIKSNMPSKIAFRVNTKMDSRIVLDQNGADLLLGQGDMLFLPPGSAKPIRSQGTYVDDRETRESVKLIKALAEAQFEPELMQIKGKVGHAGRLVGSRVLVTEPLPYLAFLGLMAESRAVVTDSGGVQEETSALGVPCFTLRDNTERPITVELGTNTLLGARPERLVEVVGLLETPKHGSPIPLWDGAAGERAADAIASELGDAGSSGRRL